MAVKTVSWKRNRQKRLDTARKVVALALTLLYYNSYSFGFHAYRFPVQQSKVFLTVILLFYSFFVCFVFVFRGPLGRILFIVTGVTLLK